MTNVRLSDLFYYLGFDNVIWGEIDRVINGKLEVDEIINLPEIPELRKWAEQAAEKFEVKSH